MAEIERISAAEARQRVSSADKDAILVCAYRNEGKCEKLKLDGSIPVEQVEDRMSEFPREQEMIFYCN